ncbi:MAG: helix-turn-helix transcriptional regulator, partial [Gemmatimonadetes bacterium]|nr:helix-turn-helix transcriptional regulator [Gemmatimonadota bacterium]
MPNLPAPAAGVSGAHPAKQVLADRGISQRRLAAALGLTPEFVCRCLNGVTPTTPSFRAALCALLDAPAESLFHPDRRPRQKRTTEPTERLRRGKRSGWPCGTSPE